MHVVSGLIRKAPFIKSGCGPQGDSTMYAIELSEMTKDYKTGEKEYTNYKALMFAKSPQHIEYYNKALSEGSFVVISCDKLKIESREHEGRTYITLNMDNARLDGAKYPEGAQGWGQPVQPQGGQPQYQQQPQQQQRPQNTPQYNEPPMDFSDDIPF